MDGATFYTEVQAGNDLGGLETVAERIDERRWRLRGVKYFTSNVGLADAAIITAKPAPPRPGAKGVAAFFAPAYRAGGRPNWRILRLKDKLCTITVPTGEVELVDTEAYLLGATEAGIYMAVGRLLGEGDGAEEACVGDQIPRDEVIQQISLAHYRFRHHAEFEEVVKGLKVAGGDLHVVYLLSPHAPPLEDRFSVVVHVVESGPWGGYALMDADFGAAMGHYAVLPMPEQFVLYEGGAIDATSLGFLQVDKEGNINPAFLPGRLPGPGGFPVIAIGSPRVYFAGGFTAGRRRIEVKDCRLVIAEDGPIVKFVEKVYKIVFSGRYAVEEEKEVLYVTERAVFRLTPSGVELVETAPGVDLEKDVLSKAEFRPVVRHVEEMEKKIFCEGKMGLREKALEIIKR